MVKYIIRHPDVAWSSMMMLSDSNQSALEPDVIDAFRLVGSKFTWGFVDWLLVT